VIAPALPKPIALMGSSQNGIVATAGARTELEDTRWSTVESWPPTISIVIWMRFALN
jgi:hypothetical protein